MECNGVEELATEYLRLQEEDRLYEEEAINIAQKIFKKSQEKYIVGPLQKETRLYKLNVKQREYIRELVGKYYVACKKSKEEKLSKVEKHLNVKIKEKNGILTYEDKETKTIIPYEEYERRYKEWKRKERLEQVDKEKRLSSLGIHDNEWDGRPDISYQSHSRINNEDLENIYEVLNASNDLADETILPSVPVGIHEEIRKKLEEERKKINEDIIAAKLEMARKCDEIFDEYITFAERKRLELTKIYNRYMSRETETNSL